MHTIRAIGNRTMQTQEEIDEVFALVDEFLEALRTGDEEKKAEYRKKIKYEASSLMAMKKTFGADHVRKHGYNTEKADKVYGPGWLDRED